MSPEKLGTHIYLCCSFTYDIKKNNYRTDIELEYAFVCTLAKFGKFALLITLKIQCFIVALRRVHKFQLYDRLRAPLCTLVK